MFCILRNKKLGAKRFPTFKDAIAFVKSISVDTRSQFVITRVPTPKAPAH